MDYTAKRKVIDHHIEKLYAKGLTDSQIMYSRVIIDNVLCILVREGETWVAYEMENVNTYSTRTKNLDFSAALAAAKYEGRRIRRAGWNGKGMWVAVSGPRGSVLDADKFWNRHARKHAEDNGGIAEVLPYLIMKTADGKILMGWLASQTDMLADDWEIVEDEN